MKKETQIGIGIGLLIIIVLVIARKQKAKKAAVLPESMTQGGQTFQAPSNPFPSDENEYGSYEWIWNPNAFFDLF